MNECVEHYILKNNYIDLRKKEVYELELLNIMNSSKSVFKSKYTHIEKQSDGECDYISEDGELLDAKILFYEEQCHILSKNDIENFIKTIQSEMGEVYDLILEEKYDKIKKTVIYKHISEQLIKIESNENAILFIPFGFTDECEYSLTSFCQTDIFSFILYYMKKDYPDFFISHKIYMIYPNIENKIILKSYSEKEYLIEFLASDILKKYIEVKVISLT